MQAEQSKFELKESDSQWFAKLNSSFWNIHIDYGNDHIRREYNRASGTRLKPMEWRGLVVLINKYELPCSFVNNPSNFYRYKFIIYDHSPFMSITPEILLEIVPQHLMDMAEGYKINREKRLLKEITRDIVQRKRNTELLNFYGLPVPEDKDFWAL